MNAYELADKAEQLKTGEYGYVDGWMDEAADMLRQQADRIAELESQCEPVAWMNGNEICPEIGYEATITTKHPKDLGWIPLYTHPVKELTDELFDKIFADGKRLGVFETEDRFYKAMQLSDEEINLLKAEIAAHKKTNELLSKKIIELERHNKK